MSFASTPGISAWTIISFSISDTESKALQVKDKAEVTSSAEQTRPGPVFTPAVDIFETDKEITLLADLPGVKTDDLNRFLKGSINLT